MNDERLRQLYGRGIAARDSRSELTDACAIEPARLLTLVRGELPDSERLALLDEVMSSRACQEAFELLRVVEAAGRASLAADSDTGGGSAESSDVDGVASDRGIHVDSPLESLSGSPSASVPATQRSQGAMPASAASRSWWRRNGASMALAASALLAVGLFANGRWNSDVEPTRGLEDDVQLVAPAVNADVEAGVANFVWHPVPDAIRYEFELLSATGEPLYRTATTDTVVARPAGVTLIPGTEYRWLVRALTAGGQRSSAARPLLMPRR